MTVMTTARKVIGFGNGATTVWPYAFLIPLASELSVVYMNPNRDAIDPTGLGVVLNPALYTVTGIGNVGGGNVTYPLAGPAVAAPVTITIVRTIPKTQPSTMQNQGASYPATYEAALDNVEMQVQEVVEIFNRSFSLPIGFDVAGQGVNLTVPAPVANMVLGWDPTAKFLVNLAAVPGLVIAPLIGGLLFGAVGNTVAQDANNLFWDNVTKRLGIGNAAPSTALDVTGAIKAQYFQATGTVSSPGAMSFESNFLVLQGGTAGFQVRDSGDANTNLQITDAGVATFRTSVVTPLLASAGNLLIQSPGGGNLEFSSGTGTVRTNSDFTHIFGDPTHRWITGYFSNIDSGTGASLFLRTGNGNTSFEVIQAGAGAVNWWGVSGQATGITPFLGVRGETNVTGVIQGLKGTGTLRINEAVNNTTQFEVLSVPTAARWITSAASISGQPILGATSSAGVAIVGTATNDSAATGQYGEFVSTVLGSGSAVALATVTPSNVASVTLGAGDWDVCGTVSFIFGATTSYTNLIGDFSVTTGTLDGIIGHFFDYETPAQVPTAGSDQAWVMPTARFSLSASTTIFLVAQATFTVSTLKAYGTIRARRVR